MSARRVFVHVQHLLGIGHLKRAATLARALAAQGLHVTLASGGLPVPDIAQQLSKQGVQLVQLPPARARDLSFRTLLDEAGREIDAQWMHRRSAALQAAWLAAEPHVLVLELFPFGRRQLRFELLPLLEAAAAGPRRPVVLSSVRDILGGRKSPERQQETLELVERRFDRILVHGDPAVIAFDRTFPGAARIADRIAYTGYVIDPAAPRSGTTGEGEVVVSAGGGAVGGRLLEAAIRAKPLTALRDRPWRVLAGDNLPEDAFRTIAALAAATGGIELERSRRDFATLLANCELTVSQAGYNTLLETVQARARAVVVPFAGGEETEQTLRARCFSARGLLEMVEERDLTPPALAAAIDRAAQKPRPMAVAVDLDGASKSAALIARLAQERPA